MLDVDDGASSGEDEHAVASLTKAADASWYFYFLLDFHCLSADLGYKAITRS